jgi:glycosyltransferase involved in cell wall biosynthesis
MRRLRVCHLSKYYPPSPGGIETHVRTLARAQAEQGAEVSVFCVNDAGATTAVERDGPVEVTRFARAVGAAKLDFCPGLAAALARPDADLLHLHAPGPTMTLALFRARPDRPLVVTYHSDVVRQKVRAALFRPIERSVYRRVAAILTTSPPYAEGSAFLRPYRDRVRVLPHGIDLAPYLDPSPSHVAESRAIRGRYAGPLWLGCGRMVYYKGFSNAIRALADVPGTLLLSGDGPDAPALRAEAEGLGLADRVAFLGNLPHYLDLIPYYLAADAFWFPSNARSEAFGLVQVEAMACGLPVINAAIPHSGVDWVSPHGETGLTVPINDPAALAAAARRLLDEPGLRDRLGASGRERATREFDHRVMAGRSLAIYEGVLAGRAGAPAPAGDGPPAGDAEEGSALLAPARGATQA